jgi:hypothetical protein
MILDASGKPANPLSDGLIDSLAAVCTPYGYAPRFRFSSRILDERGKPYQSAFRIGETIKIQRPTRFAGAAR